jgi:CPA1 family monovalent cation:H+ antiporter
MLRLRRWVHNPQIEIILSVLTPFVAYWPPEHLGGSGVLATVTAGLYFSWNGLRLISAATRLHGIFFWDFLIYLVEGMVFVITGLQARSLMNAVGSYSAFQLAVAATVVTAVVIVARFIWMYPATYLPRWFFPAIRRKDPSPPWQWPFVMAFTGVRGIVSLAAALAIPLTTANGAPFPQRSLILFLTLFVILVTLVGQGLLLPTVVRWLGLARTGRRERQADKAEEFGARRQAIGAAIARLDELAAQRHLAEDIVRPILARHRDRLQLVEYRSDGDDGHKRLVEHHDEIELLLIEVERQRINNLYRCGKFKDEARRRIERELDLRKAIFANLRNADDG